MLKEIQEAAVFLYLSDLHNNFFDEKLKKYIFSIPNDRYSLKDWNLASEYILGKGVEFSSIQNAKEEIAKRK